MLRAKPFLHCELFGQRGNHIEYFFFRQTVEADFKKHVVMCEFRINASAAEVLKKYGFTVYNGWLKRFIGNGNDAGKRLLPLVSFDFDAAG